jgi:peptide deformylase
MTGGQAVQISELLEVVRAKDVTIGKLDRQVEQLRIERDTLVGRVMDLEADLDKLAAALDRHVQRALTSDER